MSIYLPIAEMSVNIFLLLSLGGVAGFLAGMFGVGGGFLMTPFLIFIGIPPTVAVATSANQIIAASFSGFLAHFRRQNVDLKIGMFMLAGGAVGASLGVWLFAYLKQVGQMDFVISLSYVLFLGSIGTIMATESFKVIFHKRRGTTPKKKDKKNWLRRLPLPWQVYFPKSEITVSAILPIGIGLCSSVLVSIIGIGGGFIMIPAMIYILGMPTAIVIGTSLFQIVFVTCQVTLLQAINTQTVDIILAVLMIIGSVFGAQIGTRMGLKIAAEYIRAMLALMVLAVVIKLAFGLFLEPDDLYTVMPLAKL